VCLEIVANQVITKLCTHLSDTAAVYKNEGNIGKALKILLPKHGLTREDIFITSKLGNIKN